MRFIIPFYLIFLVLILWPLTLWTQSNLDWLLHAHVPFWISLIITLICNAIIIPADIIVSLLQLVVHR